MADEWEQYAHRYAAERTETYDAYVDVWTRTPAARAEFSGWSLFSQMANAEPKLRREQLDRVRVAERIMVDAGYEIGPSTTRGGRRWMKRSEAR